MLGFKKSPSDVGHSEYKQGSKARKTLSTVIGTGDMKKRYTERVNKIIKFIELLRIPSGKGEGDTFKLMPFQKDFINAVYGPVDKDGRRIVRRAILSMGRKNGKTMLTACLVLVHLWGPEKSMNAECYACANDREQAGILFRYCSQIVRADPDISAAIKVVDSTKTMIAWDTGSVFRAVSAEAGTKMGLNPTFVAFDELAQAKNRDLYDAFDTSFGARPEPLFIVISTQSNDPQHPLSTLIDDGLSKRDPSTVCHLYAADDDAENIYTDKEVWKVANPALGKFRSLEDMTTAAKRAQRMPSFEASFRNLNLNQRCDSKSPLIPRAEWTGCKTDATLEEGAGIYLALDLSGKTDLTALLGVSAGENETVKAWFWKPGDTIREHENRDRVPYWTWKQQGYIETTPGRAVNYDFVAERLAGIMKKYNVLGMAYDRWSIDDFLNACNRIGLDAYVDGKDEPRAGALRLVPWGQGFKDMA
ncbi:MAG: terminase large subunit, partial [Syntrophorhabdaceae bacterium]|nr:terminase large subunit [Syntrophorhabdaceae bacterium]